MPLDSTKFSDREVFDLKRTHENRIEHLQNQIKKMQEEIDLLKEYINTDKEYEC